MTVPFSTRIVQTEFGNQTQPRTRTNFWSGWSCNQLCLHCPHMHTLSHLEESVGGADHVLDDGDDVAPLFGVLRRLHLELAALRLVQHVRSEECRHVVRVHLVARQLRETQIFVLIHSTVSLSFGDGVCLVSVFTWVNGEIVVFKALVRASVLRITQHTAPRSGTHQVSVLIDGVGRAGDDAAQEAQQRPQRVAVHGGKQRDQVVHRAVPHVRVTQFCR